MLRFLLHSVGKSDRIGFIVGSFVRSLAGGLWLLVIVGLPNVDETKSIAFFQSLVAFLVILQSLCLGRSSDRLLFDYRDSKSREKYTASVILAMLVLAVVSYLVVCLIFVVWGGDMKMVRLGVVCALFQSFLELRLAYLRVIGRGMLFLFENIPALIAAFTPAILVIVMHASISTVSVAAIWGLGGCLHLIRYIRIGPYLDLSFSEVVKIWRAAARYALPIVVHSIGLWGIGLSGRWIARFVGIEGGDGYWLFTILGFSMTAIPVAVFGSNLKRIMVAHEEGRLSAVRAEQRMSILISFASLIGIYLVLAIIWNLELLPNRLKVSGWVMIASLMYNFIHVVYLVGQQKMWLRKESATLAVISVLTGTMALAMQYAMASLFGNTGIIGAVLLSIGIQAFLANRPEFLPMGSRARKVKL